MKGLGIFETMRAYKGEIIYLDRHLRRLEKSAKVIAIKLPYPCLKLKEMIKKAVEACGYPDAYVRLAIWKQAKGKGMSVIVNKYGPPSSKKYKRGFSAFVSSLRQDELNPLARIKTTSRSLFQSAYTEAADKGFDEALILNKGGHIAESSRANIFFIKDKKIFTPSLDCGCLDGITRRAVFDLAKKNKIKVYEGKFSIEDLYKADEAFLTNSLMGVMPLTSCEAKAIGEGKCGRLTGQLQKKYNCLLK